MVSENKIAKF